MQGRESKGISIGFAGLAFIGLLVVYAAIASGIRALEPVLAEVWDFLLPGLAIATIVAIGLSLAALLLGLIVAPTVWMIGAFQEWRQDRGAKLGLKSAWYLICTVGAWLIGIQGFIILVQVGFSIH